jgi:hypothetical protein
MLVAQDAAVDQVWDPILTELEVTAIPTNSPCSPIMPQLGHANPSPRLHVMAVTGRATSA